jgi:FAD synthetase
MSATSRVGIIVIGNEVLSGKVTDINSTFLIAELRPLGVEIARVVMIPDDVPTIAEHVRAFSGLFDAVLTTGGVGPTHDDKTFDAVAAAFDTPLDKNAELERVIREYFKGGDAELYLRMAYLPRGTELLWAPGLLFPVTLVRNVYVLPGDPTVLKKKFLAIKERFRQAPFHLRKIFTTLDEGPIASLLATVEAQFPGLLIGSYPVYDDRDYKVQITVESKTAEDVEAAYRALLDGIPEAAVRRTE